jgi:hypothetical protein
MPSCKLKDEVENTLLNILKYSTANLIMKIVEHKEFDGNFIFDRNLSINLTKINI